MVAFQLIAARWQELAFVAGVSLFLGSFLNRCILRLALEKSVFWPVRRYCDRCYQPLPLRFSIPLIGGLLCWFRCRQCGNRLGTRGPVIELVTVLAMCGLYVSHVIWGGFFSLPDIGPIVPGMSPEKHMAVFFYHALLLCFLIVATFIDLDYMIVPDSVTIPGILVGIFMGTFWFLEIHPVILWMWSPFPDLNEVMSERNFDYYWNLWTGAKEGLPAWAESVRAAIEWHWRYEGNCVRWLAFATGLVGAMAGWASTQAIRVLLSWSFGREAMGYGDVILMAMIGSFLGWQAAIMVLVVFAPVSGLFFGLLSWIFKGRVEFAFVPHLSIGAAIVVFGWKPIWRNAYFTVFDLVYSNAGYAMVAVAVMLVLLVLVGLFVSWSKQLLGRAFGGT